MTAYSTSQDGYQPGPLSGVWDETEQQTRPYGLVSSPCGVAFQLTTGIAYSGATLTLHYGTTEAFPGGVGFPSTLHLWLEDAVAPLAWSAGNFPTTAGATQLAQVTIPTVPSPLVFDVAAAVLARSQAAGWSGRLGFVISGGPLMVYTDVWSSRNVNAYLRPVLEATSPVSLAARPGPLNVWHVEPSARPRRRR